MMAAPQKRTPRVGPEASAENRNKPTHFASHAEGPQGQRADDDEAFRRMQISAARLGSTLHALGCGGFLLTRWAACKELPDLAAVGALLRRMEGRRS